MDDEIPTFTIDIKTANSMLYREITSKYWQLVIHVSGEAYFLSRRNLEHEQRYMKSDFIAPLYKPEYYSDDDVIVKIRYQKDKSGASDVASNNRTADVPKGAVFVKVVP